MLKIKGKKSLFAINTIAYLKNPPIKASEKINCISKLRQPQKHHVSNSLLNVISNIKILHLYLANVHQPYLQKILYCLYIGDYLYL